MSERDITDEFVLLIYGWFQSAMRSVGRSTNMPHCVDITKTYTFRAVQTFAHKCYDQWELDDKTIRALVYDVVKYAAKQGLLSKGTQVLNMGTVLDICRKGLKDTIEAENNLVTELERCDRFVNTIGKDNLVHKLVKPVTVGGYSQLVFWFNQGYLTSTYIALSRPCLKALHALSMAERSELPSDSELLRICTHTVADDTLTELQRILGADLRIPPTVRIK